MQHLVKRYRSAFSVSDAAARYFSKMRSKAAGSKTKQQQVQKKLKLGKTSNSLKMGIIGLTNVGKSSLFNLLSHQHVPVANKLFCTIDPNIAQV